MKFADVNGPGPGGAPYPADSYGGNYYVSPYYGTDLSTGQSNILLFCLDFDHDINFNQIWDAVIHGVPSTEAGFNAVAPAFQFGTVPSGSSGPTFVQPLPSGEFVSLDSWQRYQVAAHLFNQELGLLGPGLASTSATFTRDRAVYQYAVWEIFLENNYTDPATSHTYNYVNDFLASFNRIGAADSHFQSDVQLALNEALADFNPGDLSGWSVVSPNPANGPSSAQEFLSPTAINSNLIIPNPEPSTIVLLGTIVVLAAGGVRRRRRG